MVIDSHDPNAALIAVETDKDLAQACGRFTLRFAPERDREGRRWDQIIPKRALVVIDMERADASLEGGDARTVMLGLTDDHSMQSTFSDVRPRRLVQIHGREISCVIVDAMLWFNMALARHPELGTLTLHSLDGAVQQVALTYNPNLAHAGEDPRRIISRMLDYYLFVGGEAIAPATTPGLQRPVISLDIPDTELSKVLVKNEAAWKLFVPGVAVPVVQFPAASGSLWNYLHLFIDGAFQEFFTRIEDGVCKIHFRGKPFQHRIIIRGTRFKSMEEEPTLRTLALDPADILSIAVRAQTSQVLNVFQAGPRGIDALYEIPGYNSLILPQIIKDAAHPSFVGRYGLRVLQVESPYLQPFAVGTGEPFTGESLTPPSAGTEMYANMANQIATANAIPAFHRPWFVSLIRQESRFDPNATHKNSDGTVDQGLGQFHVPYPVGVTLTNPFDPVQSLNAAAQYWNILRTYAWIGDDPIKIVAAYNGGPTGIQTGFSPAVQRHVAGVQSHVGTYAHYGGTATIPSPTAPRASAPETQTTGPIEDMVKVAQHWAAILRGWYDVEGELFSGTLVVRGQPGWNIGDRLTSVDDRGAWEAYIEGVRHTFDIRTGQYLTHLRITRGWYLSVAIAQQIWDEGRTQIENTEGGPPDIDPETGEGQKEVIVIFPQYPEIPPFGAEEP